MPIKHATTKAIGEKLHALTDWNINHTGTITASEVSDFDAEVSNNLSVVANTSKITSQWTTNGDKIYYNTGFVGIGTTAPTSNLHVAGTDPEIRLTNTGNSKSVYTKRETGKGFVKNQVLKPSGGYYALDFDGAHDYVDCGNSNDFDTQLEFTFEAWIYPTDLTSGTYHALMVHRGTAIIGLWSLGSSLYALVRNDAGSTEVAGTVGGLSLNTWQHVALTINASGIVKVWVDSVPITLGGIVTGPFTDFTSGLLIGHHVSGTQYFKGKMDEVRVYTRGLEQAEINYNYNGGAGVYTPYSTSGLVGWWHFDTGSGVVAVDSSGEGNTGTLIGVPDWVGGYIPSSGITEEALVWESKDGIGPGEQGIQSFGDPDGGTIIQGKTQKFFIGASEKMRIDETGNLILGLGGATISNLTTIQKNALTPTNGMIVYDTDLNKFQGYENGAWANLI